MVDGTQLKKRILNDMRVMLSEEFDRNFERKGFFSEKWKARAVPDSKQKGTLLMVTGTMRRSIRAQVDGSGVRFTSAVPYAAIHNEGGEGIKTVKAHYRRSRKGKVYQVRQHTRRFKMPKRQFVGDGSDTRRIIHKCIDDNVKRFATELSNHIKQ